MANETTKPASVSCKFSITRKIAELLNLGDSGKIDSFLTRVIKTLTGDIKGLNHNLGALKFTNTQENDALADRLEDAKEALANEYLNIQSESVETNAKQTEFIDVYLGNISRKQKEVESIELEIKSLKESYDAKVKDINDQIASLTAKIETMSNAA